MGMRSRIGASAGTPLYKMAKGVALHDQQSSTIYAAPHTSGYLTLESTCTTGRADIDTVGGSIIIVWFLWYDFITNLHQHPSRKHHPLSISRCLRFYLNTPTQLPNSVHSMMTILLNYQHGVPTTLIAEPYVKNLSRIQIDRSFVE